MLSDFDKNVDPLERSETGEPASPSEEDPDPMGSAEHLNARPWPPTTGLLLRDRVHHPADEQDYSAAPVADQK